MAHRFSHIALILALLPCLALGEGIKIKVKSGKLKQLSEELELSDEQKTKIKDLFKANKHKLKALKEAHQDEVLDSLTAEQKLKLLKLGKKKSDASPIQPQDTSSQSTEVKPKAK